MGHTTITDRDQLVRDNLAHLQRLNSYNHITQILPSHTQSKWRFAGRDCTVEEFARTIWPDNCEDRVLFILTHGGAESTPD